MQFVEFASLVKQAVSILVKFQKIKRHTDPSTEDKKKLFLQKYRNLISQIVKGLKTLNASSNVYFWLERVKKENSFSLGEKNLEVVFNKIKNDIDHYFIEAPTLPEFKETKKKDYLKKYTNPSKVTSPTTANPLPNPQQYYTRESLMDLVRSTKKKREMAREKKKALEDLSNYIKKLRKIDPNIIAKKVAEIVKKQT